MFPLSSAYTKFCDGARQPASAARNWAKSGAWLMARITARYREGMLPIQSTDAVCPGRGRRHLGQDGGDGLNSLRITAEKVPARCGGRAVGRPPVAGRATVHRSG